MWFGNTTVDYKNLNLGTIFFQYYNNNKNIGLIRFFVLFNVVIKWTWTCWKKWQNRNACMNENMVENFITSSMDWPTNQFVCCGRGLIPWLWVFWREEGLGDCWLSWKAFGFLMDWGTWILYCDVSHSHRPVQIQACSSSSSSFFNKNSSMFMLFLLLLIWLYLYNNCTVTI